MKELEPEFVISKGEWSVNQIVTPPYTDEEKKMIKMFSFYGLSFLQDHQLTTRKIIQTLEDIDSYILKVKDLTKEGLEFYRTVYEPKYLNIPDFTKDPQKRVKAILEKNLKNTKN